MRCRFGAQEAEYSRAPSLPRRLLCGSRTTPSRKPCTDPARRHPTTSRRRWRDGSRTPGRGRWRPVATCPPGRAALASDQTATGKSPSSVPRALPAALRRKRVRGSPTMALPLARIICKARSFPGRKEMRMASCRSTTRWMAISASSKVILPFISTKPQIWFAGSATATGDVSHNSRWGKVIGWRRASPLSSRCLKSARLSPDMVSARLVSARLISDRELRPQWRRRRADGRCPRRTTPPDRHPRSPRLPPEPRRPQVLE